MEHREDSLGRVNKSGLHSEFGKWINERNVVMHISMCEGLPYKKKSASSFICDIVTVKRELCVISKLYI